MPNYRRPYVPGGTFFLTLVTEGRAPLFSNASNRSLLRSAIASARSSRPFSLDAIVLLPDHVHLILTLPVGDANFSTRIASIKSGFTHAYLADDSPEQPRSYSRYRHRRRGVWQRKFWDHAIRDTNDLNNHLDYIHYNPVKHGLATCPHAWPHSSFARAVRNNLYPSDWLCACHATPQPPDFSNLNLE